MSTPSIRPGTLVVAGAVLLALLASVTPAGAAPATAAPAGTRPASASPAPSGALRPDPQALADSQRSRRAARDGAQIRRRDTVVPSRSHASVAQALDGSLVSVVPGAARRPLSTWSVTYVGFDPASKAAFQRAVDIWAGLVDSPVPITVCATYADLGDPDLLGQAGPGGVHYVSTSAGTSVYAAALANTLAERDLDPPAPGTLASACSDDGGYDIQAEFNDTSVFYTGSSDLPPSGTVDLQTVVLHELGHGLGFLGSMYVNSSGLGYYDSPPDVYDRFTVDAQGRPLLAQPRGSATLGSALRTSVSWNGREGVQANGGSRPRLYAPATYQGGSSYSHLDEATYPRGNRNSLMTPQVSDQEVIRDPGPIAMGMLRDTGYPAAVNEGAFTADDGSIDLASRYARTGVELRSVSTSGTLSTATALGGAVRGRPAVARRPSGSLELFVRGTNDRLYTRVRSSAGTWGGWQDLGGVLGGSPSVTRYRADELHVFVRGSDGRLHHRWSTFPGSWSGWEDLGGQLVGGPAATSPAAGSIDVVVRGTDDVAYRKTYSSGWQGFTRVGGVLASDPALASADDGQATLLVRGADSALYSASLSRTGATAFSPLGGLTASAPAAAARARSSQVDAFVTGTNGVRYRNTRAQGVWSGYRPTG